MTNARRAQSEGDVFHVTARGNGQQIIFEDDADRAYYLENLFSGAAQHDVEIVAWCLMVNHVHILLHAPMEKISALMHQLQTSYAMYYNKRYERVGSLFQGRFTSVPIADDEQLMTVVRYIHHNPIGKEGPLDYVWSSYSIFLNPAKLTTTQKMVLELYGGIERYVTFHSEHPVRRLPNTTRRRLTQSEALKLARDTIAPYDIYELKTLDKRTRNEMIRKLKDVGLSNRQICRLTSIGRSIVNRA